jgi:membrane protease YdiL (CAAX protease family)
MLRVVDSRFSRLRLGRLAWWPLAGVAAVVAGFAALVLVGLVRPRPGAPTLATAIAYVFPGLLLAAGLAACREAGITPAEVVGPRPRGTAPWLTAALLAPLLVVLGGLALWGTVALAGAVAPEWAAARIPPRGAPGLLSRFGPAHRLLLGVSIVAVGPAVEEFVFRGLLLRRWVATRGLWPGVLGSAAVFALLHPPMWVGSFVFGVALGLLYLGSRSLLPSVLAHILHNGLVVATALGADAEPAPAAPAQALAEALAEAQAEWAIPAAGLLVVGALVAALARPLVRRARVGLHAA